MKRTATNPETYLRIKKMRISIFELKNVLSTLHLYMHWPPHDCEIFKEPDPDLRSFQLALQMISVNLNMLYVPLVRQCFEALK